MLVYAMIILAAGTMLLLAILIGYVLGWANKTFHVQVDPKVEQTLAALPGANCGGCGYVGCADYAEAVVLKGEAVDKCTVGGHSCAAALAKILGVEVQQSWPKRPIVHCGAKSADRLKKADYRGVPSCTAANMISGVQGCTYGCMGMGDCESVCKYDAIHVIDGLAVVDYEKCTGCSACSKICPRHVITMAPFKADRMLAVACSNKDFGRDVRAVCKVGCSGCKLCEKTSPLFKVSNNLPSLDYAAYEPARVSELQGAVEKCPMKRLLFVGKPTPADLAAVAGETLPEIIEAKPETTVDKTDWRG